MRAAAIEKRLAAAELGADAAVRRVKALSDIPEWVHWLTCAELDELETDDSNALMACGYQMASKAFQRAQERGELRGLGSDPTPAQWPFSEILDEIRSTKEDTPRRRGLLAALREGSSVRL